MPLNVPDNLPAIEVLQRENIFIMDESRAIHQDIRPIRIVILNIMPIKQTTETHLLRVLSNTPLQTEIQLLYPISHVSKTAPIEYLRTFYKTFDEIKDQNFDGMIITGAPVELLEFEEVDYWDELREIMDWSAKHVTSTLFICWGAQAGLYHFFNIPKYPLPKKMFGIFPHYINNKIIPLTRGFDDLFLAPHSRHTEIKAEDVRKIEQLDLVVESEIAGVYIVMNRNGRQIFVTGHSEYDPDTLKTEYERDLKKGLEVEIPYNYFPDNNPEKEPSVTWRSHANLLFTNWLNYYVYQITPYDLNKLTQD